MAILTREEYLQALQQFVGDSTDDNTLAFVENMTDTFTDLEGRANPNGVNWEQKYKDNDAEWREKYRQRFFSGEVNEPTPQHEPPVVKTFEDLFSKGEK